MRASRLLSVLLLLRSRGRMTAAELASELEVSVRTVYRDMDSLAASGVPVDADRGPTGGYRLAPSRADLEEADPLGRAGGPGAAAELALGRVLAGVRHGAAPAPPAGASELSERAGRIAERFHLDAAGWFRDADDVPTLTGVADAVWNQRVLHLRYRRRGEEEVVGEVEPLGVVLKTGTWFLVARPRPGPGARPDPDPRTYRVAEIVALQTLDVRFTRPDGFDLWRYWNRPRGARTAALYQVAATIRISPEGLARAPVVLRPHTARALAERVWPADDADGDGGGGDGWVRALVPVESLADARHELLALGPEVEVLAPAPLRRQMHDAARALASLYATRGP